MTTDSFETLSDEDGDEDMVNLDDSGLRKNSPCYALYTDIPCLVERRRQKRDFRQRHKMRKKKRMGSGVQINLEGKSEIIIGIYELEVASSSLPSMCLCAHVCTVLFQISPE